jgi:hypothetical protein
MTKLRDIVRAWLSSFNPTERQRKLANARYEVCRWCSFYLSSIDACTACGCMVNKKVYSEQYGACPMGKWDGVDNSFYKK